MPKITKKHLLYALGVVLSVIGFVFISQASQAYGETLQSLTEQAGLLGILSYIGVMIISIVVAPIGTGFLLPIAANSWGPFLAATYSVVGWTAGSMIAFFLARRYGLKLVKHFETVKKMRKVAEAIPEHHTFWGIVFLRMALPVDLLSYAIGIFTSLGYWLFFWSTIIGITPFAFILSYAATSSITFQIVVFSLSFSVFFAGVYYIYSKGKKARAKTIKDSDVDSAIMKE